MTVVNDSVSDHHHSSLSYRLDDDRLVLTGTLNRDQVDDLDVMMLKHNQVPHMVPVNIRSIDHRIVFDYMIDHRKPLGEWLRGYQITEDLQCLHFLLHIVNHLEQLRDYMLIENRCLLSPHMIFVDEKLLDAQFVYWPCATKNSDEQDIAFALQQLCVQLAKYRSMEEIRGIMRYLEDPLFSLNRLRKMLIVMIDQQTADHPRTSSKVRESEVVNRQGFRRWMPFSRRTSRQQQISAKADGDTGHTNKKFVSRKGYTVPLHSGGDVVTGVRLIIQRGDREEEVRVVRSPFVIGRDPHACDQVYEDVRVSRMHAEIQKRKDGYYIRDLGSRNGTFLNNERLVPFTDRQLQGRDCIEIADMRCRFVLDDA